jgi:hypothetical protein
MFLLLAKIIFFSILPKVECPLVVSLEQLHYKLDVPKHTSIPIRQLSKRNGIRRIHKGSRHAMFWIYH